MAKTTGAPRTGARAEFTRRAEGGRAARKSAPRSSHGSWAASPSRTDPVALLEQQAVSRVADLVPIRYARMLVSPLAFFRGAAGIMAADLAETPTSGITVQLCGDAHLSNFGVFGTPERNLIFDLNDFDETIPGPWEWDLKRLAASFEVAGRYRGFSRTQRTLICRTVARGYRERMRAASSSPVLRAWYARLDAKQVAEIVRREHRENRATKKTVDRTVWMLTKARTRDSMRAFTKLVDVVDGVMRIRPDPPLIVPLSDLAPADRDRKQNESEMRELLRQYQSTLSDQAHPLNEFEFVDMARKVVGVGSVGTRAWIVLLRGRDDSDPLLLQAKEAQASALQPYLPASEYDNQGERVVRGKRLMQAASDVFLGWQTVTGLDGVPRDFYVRQLHDWKGGAEIETMSSRGMMIYSRVCGETLARAHGRGGDRVAIAGYLGSGEVFDRAVARFAHRYADQNELDYRAFQGAVASGRLSSVEVP
jgi:uncharacterized protein (DUF2252 family)